MKSISLTELFFIFVKIGAVLLGGGYVILPIITNEFATKRQLVTEEEIIDYFTLSQSLPGIIAANISIFTGYKLRGFWGAVVAMLGIIFVPLITIIFLASCLSVITGNVFVNGIFWGVGIAVIVLIILSAREIWQKSNKDLFFYFILSISLIAILYFKLTPVKTILFITLIGLLIKFLLKRGEKL